MSSATFTVKQAHLYGASRDGDDRMLPHEKPIVKNFRVENHRASIVFNDFIEVGSETLIAVLVDDVESVQVSLRAGEFKYSSGDIPNPNVPTKALLHGAFTKYSHSSVGSVIPVQEMYVVASLSVQGGFRLASDISKCIKVREGYWKFIALTTRFTSVAWNFRQGFNRQCCVGKTPDYSGLRQLR